MKKILQIILSISLLIFLSSLCFAGDAPLDIHKQSAFGLGIVGGDDLSATFQITNESDWEIKIESNYFLNLPKDAKVSSLSNSCTAGFTKGQSCIATITVSPKDAQSIYQQGPYIAPPNRAFPAIIPGDPNDRINLHVYTDWANAPTNLANITSIVTLNKTMYVSTLNGGVYSYDADKKNWNTLNANIGSLDVVSLAVYQGNLYAWVNNRNGQTNGELLRYGSPSANQWNQVIGFNPSQARMLATDTAIIFGSGNFVASYNSGSTFTSLGGQLPANVTGLAQQGGVYYAIAGNDNIYKYDKTGNIWNSIVIATGFEPTAIVGSGTTVFVAGNIAGEHRVYKVDSNNTVALYATVPDVVTALFVDGVSKLYATTNSKGIYTLSRGSATVFGSGLPGSETVNVLAENSSGNLFVGLADTGVYAYDADNGIWNSQGTGLNVLPIANVETSVGGTFLTAGQVVMQQIGSSWSQIQSRFSAPPVSAVSDGTTIYAATSSAIYTTNNQNDWAQDSTSGVPTSGIHQLVVYAEDGSTNELYAATDSGVKVKSASAWTTLTGTAGKITELLTQPSATAGDPSTLYAAGDQGVYKLHDSTWQAVGATALSNVNQLTLDSENNLVAATAGGLFQYDVASNKWVSLNGNLPSTDIKSVTAGDNLLFVMLSDNNVYASEDGGKTWAKFNGSQDPTLFQPSKLYSTGTIVYLLTNGGLFQRYD